MEIIEFLQTTEQKNIKSYIEMKVNKKMMEYEAVLQERQQMLRDILQFENMQYNEEVVQLINEKLNEQFRKRLDWINTKRMEHTKAEEELLKLKNQQRELENCEEWRHFQGKQLLLDTKKAQLHQIEDKKIRIQKEKDIDRMWHEAMKRLNCEKEYQEIYENKLLKIIEEANQLKNLEINQNRKKQQHLECQKAKKEFQEENQKGVFMENEYLQNKKLREFLDAKQHNHILKAQIASSLEKKRLDTKLLLEEERLQKQLEDHISLSELKETERQKICSNKWHQLYLQNSLKEKQQRIQKETELDHIYLHSGCVLQQASKKPYNKTAR